jgi:hypothetical protein
LDLVIQLKADADEVNNIFKDVAEAQSKNMDLLEISKTDAGVYSGDDRSAQEIRSWSWI